MTRFSTFLSAILLASTGVLTACDDGSTNSDPTNDDDPIVDDSSDGESYAGVMASTGTQSARSAGEVDMSSAAWVEIWSVSDDGEATFQGEGEVEAGGSYEVETESEDEDSSYSLVHAFDAAGELIASAVVEGTDESDSFTSRLDVESTIEAWAFIERVEEEGDADSANYADIRSRIDASLAETVYLTDDDGEAMSALTAALDAALEAEVMSYSEDGWSGDAAALYELEAEASQALEIALTESDDVDDYDSAYGEFYASIDAALESAGIDTEERYDAESAAALSFRLTLDAMTSGEVSDVGAEASGTLEAWAMVEHITETAEESDMDEYSSSLIIDAAQSLWFDITAAENSEDTEQAWSDYSTSVFAEVDAMIEVATKGEGDLDGDGDYDLFNVITDAALGLNLEAVLEGESTFDDLDTDGDSAEAFAETAVEFWASLETSISSMVEDADGWSDAAVVSELILSASGNYYRDDS